MTNHRPDPANTTRPLPPEIYVRRRVAALAVVLVLVALLVWGLTAAARSGSSSGDSGSATSATITEDITTEPTVPAPGETTTQTSTTTTTTSTEPTTRESTTRAAAADGTCVIEDLVITARTSQPSFDPGQQPAFYMSVENPTDADCTVDLSQEQLRFEVYDMATNQRIWSDTDCHPAVVTGEQVFESRAARDFEAIWSRKDSQPGLCSNRQDVPAGSYYLHAVIGTHASDPADFT
ncbi:hypothetical protein, partial [Corynebacterium sp.]